MRDNTKEIAGKLVSQIRYLALQGQADFVWFEGKSDNYMYDGQEDIYWQTVGQLLLVYIESSGEYSYSYRLYKCSGEEARYDRKTVMDAALENDDCYCLFDLRETKGNKYLLHFHEDGIWYEDYEKAVYGMFNE